MKLIPTFGPTAAAAEAAIRSIEDRGDTSTASVAHAVADILAAVQTRGDVALLEYATRFDGFTGEIPSAHSHPLRVSRDEMETAWLATPEDLRAAMRLAQTNIRAFAERQLPGELDLCAQCGRRRPPDSSFDALSSVGCYVPGGRYPLPSTLLMTVTPAQVAGVERIVVCSPNPAPETLAAAHLAGVTRVLPHRRRPGHRRPRLRHRTAAPSPASTRSSAPATSTSPPPSSQVSHEVRHRHARRPHRDRRHQRNRRPRRHRRRPRRPGRARPRSPRHPHHLESRSSPRSPSEVRKPQPGSPTTGSRQESLAAQGCIFVTEPSDRSAQRSPTASPPNTSPSIPAKTDRALGPERRLRLYRPPHAAIHGRLHLRPQPRAPHRPHRPHPRRPQRPRLRQDHHRPATTPATALREPSAPHAIALAEAEGLVGHAESVRVKTALNVFGRAVIVRSLASNPDSATSNLQPVNACLLFELSMPTQSAFRSPPAKRQLERPHLRRTSQAPQFNTSSPQPRPRVLAMPEYHPPLASRTALLRLDFNENTFAPSPRVLARLQRTDHRRGPHHLPRARARRDRRRRDPLRPPTRPAPPHQRRRRGHPPALPAPSSKTHDEALIATPTFFMYDVSVGMMSSQPHPRPVRRLARLPLRAFSRCHHPAHQAHPRRLAQQPHRRHRLPRTPARPLPPPRHTPSSSSTRPTSTSTARPPSPTSATIPNLIVGRTFSKAYGLANLRLGMLAGDARLPQLRPQGQLSPYNVNGVALAVLPEALADQDYLDWYTAEVATPAAAGRSRPRRAQHPLLALRGQLRPLRDRPAPQRARNPHARQRRPPPRPLLRPRLRGLRPHHHRRRRPRHPAASNRPDRNVLTAR